tara:strand:- start:147 stop:473 length:327 start_codon:yes stop_codon:yes gene_type:complete
MNPSNSYSLIRLDKLLKRINLNPKYKQLIIQESQKQYSTWNSIKKLARELEFRNSILELKQSIQFKERELKHNEIEKRKTKKDLRLKKLDQTFKDEEMMSRFNKEINP